MFLFTFIVILKHIILAECIWSCWLGGRKGIRPVKNWVVGCWHGYLSGARCRLAYGPADATVTHSCFSEIQIGFAFLAPAHPGSTGKRAVKRVCVCVTFSVTDKTVLSVLPPKLISWHVQWWFWKIIFDQAGDWITPMTGRVSTVGVFVPILASSREYFWQISLIPYPVLW